MYKSICLVLFILFFTGCGSSDSSNTTSSIENESYFNVVKAPIAGVPVSIFQKLALEFSNDLNTSSVTSTSAYMQDSNQNIVGVTLGLDDPRKVVFTPYQYLKPSSSYTLVITTAVKNTLGQSLSKNYTYSFTTKADTIDNTPISFVGIKPQNGSVTADPLSEISLQFSKFISPDAQYNGSSLIKVSTGGVEVAGSLEFFNSVVTFKPTSPLLNDANYSVELVGTLTDMYGSSYSGTTTWNFQVGTSSTNLNKGSNFLAGHNSLYKYVLNKQSSMIEQIEITGTPTSHTLVVATTDGLDFFDVQTNTLLPSLSKYSFRFALVSSVTDLKIHKQYILVSTLSDGFYLLKFSTTGVTQLAHETSVDAIYGVAFGTTIELILDRVYAVGPKYGLKVFSFDDVSETLAAVKNVSVAGTPLKVMSTSYIVSQNNKVGVFVVDYKSGIRAYDFNGTIDSSVGSNGVIDLNGSTKNLVLNLDSSGGSVVGMISTNSLGLGYIMDFNGTISATAQTPSSATDIATMFNQGNVKLFTVDKNKGLLIDSAGLSFTKGSIIKSSGTMVSSVPFVNQNNSYFYVATLDSNGEINIFNALAKTTGPHFTHAPTSGASSVALDSNVTIEFDKEVNASSITQQSFTFKEKLSGTDINFTLNGPTYNTGTSTYVCKLQPDANLTSAMDYNVSVKSSVKDIIGNPSAGDSVSAHFFIFKTL